MPLEPRRQRLVVLLVALLLAIPVVTVGVSYGRALTYPGTASWQVRTVEWVRDHGGSGLVNAVENWWFAHNGPTGAAPAPDTLPATGPVPPTAAVGPPALPLLPAAAPLPGEAVWRGSPALYTGYFRPDPAYPSQIVGVAWMNQDAVATRLVPGTREPVVGTPPAQAQIPAELRSSLVAAFNSGWKLKDITGGFYAGGRAVVPLRDGAASLVIDTTGRVTVGRWGRDARMGAGVAAVRQNLDLVVDGGRPVPGLTDNASGAWGSPKNQFQYTWRSGLGTDATGNLVYVGGDKLTLAGLAHAMVLAGVQRGMELDIHGGMVTFTSFRPAAGAAYGVRGSKLLPAMPGPTTRYLVPDQRDFLAVTARPAASVK